MTFIYFARLQGTLAKNFINLQKLKLGSVASIRCASSTTFPPTFSPVFGGIQEHLNKLAVVDALGSHTYDELLSFSQQIQKQISKLASSCDQMRISYLCPSDVRYVATQWACWLGGNVAVPLYHQHPDAMLEYYIKDSQTSILLTTQEYKERILKLSEQLSLPYIVIDRPNKKKAEEIESKDWESLKEQDALMMYTSGTTGPPKGVVLSFNNVHFQVAQIRKAWEWAPADVMLHALPLHHTHGIISGLLTPLYSRAACVMLPKFNPAEVWEHLLHLDKSKPAVSVFMAVPTMYVKLIEHYEQHLKHCKETAPNVVRDTFAKNIRFVISGSASLPQPIFEKFHDITGMTILERYGMTEVGVPLSNLLHGKRHPGCVGYPTAGVEVCIAEADDSKLGYKPLVLSTNAETKYLEGSENDSGELLIRGPNVFKYYWNRPEVTKDSFTQDGWFKTGPHEDEDLKRSTVVEQLTNMSQAGATVLTRGQGDSAACIDGVYKILGRTSADIIKTGGYKVSALDVERHLLAHPSIKECTVVGAPDATWGERVAAVVVLHEPSATLELEALRSWCKERMPTYNVPSILLCVPALERNFLGKVNKKELVKKLWPAPKQ